MFSILIIILVLCVLAILHTYLFYPAGLIFFSGKRISGEQYLLTDNLPEIAILMAAYNEEKVIEEKINSVLATSYPLNKITFLIGSDASTDRTNEIVDTFSQKHSFIKLIPFAGRTGKSGIINQLVEMTSAPVLILTDANVFFEKDTLFEMVKHFKNNQVAQVCANVIKVSAAEKGISKQETIYMALENKIKLVESINWNIVMGAEGGCNAIRKEDYSKVPDNFCVDDFYITMAAIEKGRVIYFEEKAICYEDAPSLSEVEFKRKVRISTGNFQNLNRFSSLLFSSKPGVAYAFWSHKVLRWLTPFLLILCFCLTLILGVYNFWFFIFAIIQILGLITPLIPIEIKIYKLVSHFYLMNFALLKGFFAYAKGVETNIWQPTKRNV